MFLASLGLLFALLDGTEEFTPAQEQQPVCIDPRHRSLCQQQPEQVCISVWVFIIVGSQPQVKQWELFKVL